MPQKPITGPLSSLSRIFLIAIRRNGGIDISFSPHNGYTSLVQDGYLNEELTDSGYRYTLTDKGEDYLYKYGPQTNSLKFS